MRQTRISKRYAKALFDMAIDIKMLDQTTKDMELVISVCKENKDFRLLLQSPIINSKKKIAIINALFEKHLQKISLHFLLIITNKRREAYLESIAKEFINLYKKYKNIITTYLKTVVKIDDDIKNKILDLMKKQTGGEIELIEEIKEELLGGFVLDFGDNKYDASILKQIEDLKKEFNINLYEKGF
ncbi:MAG: ATP synthase F1 subunit delta [Bacteroidales bacterium]|nr:ATP synthase F1 subunit delta [Bacteroidales bacterium]MCD4773058.1 ATP synthase F1 subunit delta [Bacteroidales bacterium]